MTEEEELLTGSQCTALLDSHLIGLENVFSVEALRSNRLTPMEQLKKYTFAVGLPNLGNTCYMNSLL